MDAEKLLPCPFCGGDAVVREPTDSDGFATYVSCRCGAQLFGKANHFSSATEAIAAWNRRALTPSEAEVERVARAIDAADYGECGMDYYRCMARAAIAAMREG